MRSKKAIVNILMSIMLQVTTIICGFIVPRLIINTFGSDINGITSSITQFLGYITLLESGMGGVIKAALYKPLAYNDNNGVSGILNASEYFFKKIAYIFLAYILILMIVFPKVVDSDYSNIFISSLVIIMGIGTFVQYYFGINSEILLQSDQKLHVSYIFQILSIILNTIFVVILIKIGMSIHIVKLGSALAFIIRPIALSVYVKKKYNIDKNYPADNSSIKQKWDALYHHISYFIHNNTDIVVLTIFTNFNEVSVYSIYYMIVSGIQKLVFTITNGLEATFGNMIAKDEKNTTNKYFDLLEFISHNMVTILFVSASVLALPFINIYTKGINDVNYYRPLFAYLLILGQAIYCIRLPYHSIVMVSGHFKQTKKSALIEAAINISISLITVKYLGIIGVAIGTLCAMTYRTIYYAIYLSKNILNRDIKKFSKRCIISIVSAIISIIATKILLQIETDSFIMWVLYALFVVFLTSTITAIVNALAFRKETAKIVDKFKKRLRYRKELYMKEREKA